MRGFYRMRVNDQQLSIDVYVELEPYLDRFPQYVLRDEKLQACSPFREERHPSFAVNLENGSWIDSGAVGDFRKGNFISLLAFLREESYEDTCDYLINIYSPLKADENDLHLNMNFLTANTSAAPLKVFTADELKPYAFRSTYLQQRGISEEVQRDFRVGYDPKRSAVAMCWCNQAGDVVNIKFRRVADKHFWYAGGQRIKEHLYGIHVYNRNTNSAVAITESEIDCMRLWTVGIPALALGSANTSKEQGLLLRNCGATEFIIATDNDAAGKQCGKKLEALLVGTFKVSHFNFPRKDAKDISDLTDEEIISGYTKRRSVELSNF